MLIPTGLDSGASLPALQSSDYFTNPSIRELAALEAADSGYCSRVPDFVIGRRGYGQVQFFGCTDLRWMNLDQIVKFRKNLIEVYDDEIDKPPLGHGLNKAAEVTLIVQTSRILKSSDCIEKLKEVSDKQGAHFLSFDSLSGEWKFLVPHFSRFGIDEEEEDDVVMDDVNAEPISDTKETPVHSSALVLSRSLQANHRHDPLMVQDMRDVNTAEIEEPQIHPTGAVLSHSLPAHLGLDPLKMQEMRAVMFPVEQEDEEHDGSFQEKTSYSRKEHVREDTSGSSGTSFSRKTPLQGSRRRARSKMNPSSRNKEPQALIEYKATTSYLSPSTDILMTGQRKGLPSPRLTKIEGFKLDEKIETPLPAGYSKNIVDAALFMGRSFRVGWGPNGILAHTGTSVGTPSRGLSSLIQLEKVSADRSVRDERNKVNEELDDLCFSSLLNLHKSLDHEIHEINFGSSKLKLQKVVCSRLTLSEICRAYISIIEKQIEVTGITTLSRVLLMHQVAVWELIKVLFSERETNGELKTFIDDNSEEMMLDVKDRSLDIDIEAKPFVRRAEFSYWLQDCVCHRVQDEVSCLDDSSYLKQILLLLTGRQLDAAVELAASRGDVRLAVLLSEAGGSVVNRHDMAQQLDFWRMNGLDFKYIENDRLKLYELLAGNIQVALQGSSVDWKRYLGLVMWYQLPPDTSLPVIIRTYNQLLSEDRAPHPVPVYIDERPPEEPVNWNVGDRYDMAYYLMLLHANEEKNIDLAKTMFSAFSSTHDPLDYHMIWHQRAMLEAIGAFSLDNLHVLDMSFVFQLLCLGQCHWAIYVVLHMPYHDDYPYIHTNLIKEILCRYCETWSTQELQRDFIEELGIPTEWMHEAMALYFEYHGEFREALEHFLKCYNWQKAHFIFMMSVAHCLFLSSEHQEIWRITSSMEEHKLEIADWDLGAGIYFDFYILRDSLQEEDSINEDPLGKKNEACKSFFYRLNESLLVWGKKLPIDARATFSKMSEELCSLLASTPGEQSTPAVQMNCFETMLSAPIPEDLRSSHLQNALTVFTYLLSEASA